MWVEENSSVKQSIARVKCSRPCANYGVASVRLDKAYNEEPAKNDEFQTKPPLLLLVLEVIFFKT